MSRALKHHHRERLKNKRKNYWQYGGAPDKTEKQLGMLVNTAALCSCYMCRNRRKSEGLTIQERKQEQADE